MKTIVTYETHHGSAKKAAQIIADKLDCLCVDIDTPFQAEDPEAFDRLILVISFRGPYTAQLTKLYLSRMGDKLAGKELIVVGVGLFSDQEFPVVAKALQEMVPVATFDSYFIKGQLRVATLTPEEQALLSQFSKLTGIEITDMGQFDEERAHATADDILHLVPTRLENAPAAAEKQRKWMCQICGYIYYGEEPPENCPVCSIGKEMFKEVTE